MRAVIIGGFGVLEANDNGRRMIARRIRYEKLKEHQHIEGYARCLESKEIEVEKGRNFEQMWEQMK